MLMSYVLVTLVTCDVNIWGCWVKNIWELSVLVLQLFYKLKIISKWKVKTRTDNMLSGNFAH